MNEKISFYDIYFGTRKHFQNQDGVLVGRCVPLDEVKRVLNRYTTEPVSDRSLDDVLAGALLDCDPTRDEPPVLWVTRVEAWERVE